MTNRYTNVPKSDNKPENVVIIRGGGDLASGTIHRLSLIHISEPTRPY